MSPKDYEPPLPPPPPLGPPPRSPQEHVHDFVPLPRKDYGHGVLGAQYIYCRTCGEKLWMTE